LRQRTGRRVLIDLSPLRRSRDLRCLVLGELGSVLGTQLTTVAVRARRWPGCCWPAPASGSCTGWMWPVSGPTLLAAFLISPQPPAGALGHRPGLRSIVEGLGFVRGRQVLQGAYLIDINAMVFGMPRALLAA